jgi:hypothetical protein
MPFGPYLAEKCSEQWVHLPNSKLRSHSFFISAQIRENKTSLKKEKKVVKNQSFYVVSRL